jgi:gas vesicle protein
MRHTFAMIAIVGAVVASAAAPRQGPQLNHVMREKLGHSQNDSRSGGDQRLGDPRSRESTTRGADD